MWIQKKAGQGLTDRKYKEEESMSILRFCDIRTAFIDFDDCAIIHLDHSHWDDWFKAIFKGDGSVYKLNVRTAPLPGMNWLLKGLKAAGASIYCLTQSETSLVVKPKAQVLAEAYGSTMFDDVISTGTREEKIRLIKRYCKEFEIKPEEVLLVEDNPDTVAAGIETGLHVITPQEIVCYSRTEPV